MAGKDGQGPRQPRRGRGDTKRSRSASVFLGPRLKRMRRDLGLTQAELGRDLEISPSYVALLERNQRPLTADLLLRLAETYRFDLAAFAAGKVDDAAVRLEAILKDPMFAGLEIGPADAAEAAAAHPGLVEAFLRLRNAYDEGRLALADRGQAGDVAASASAPDPVAEARRFLAARRNVFPALDEAAERLSRTIGGLDLLETHLSARHGIQVRRLPPDVMAGSVRRFDRHRGQLLIDESLDSASRRFQLALQIADLGLGEDIETVLSVAAFDSENGRRLARRSLANYAAAAILLPYGPFLRAARSLRYDVEALARRFGVSFEQAAHRLTTLQKPGEEGVPFFFIRVDAAGNVSKRLDGAGFPFARHGGSCPLWSLHSVFKTPRRIVTQWVELPEGDRFFSIARTVDAGGGRFGAPRAERAIALGCAEKHARELVYAEGRDLKSEPPDPIGVNCRLCHRTDCIARAEPPLGRAVAADEWRRPGVPFDFDDG